MQPKKKSLRKVIQNPEALQPGMILKIDDMQNANDTIIADLVKFFNLPEVEIRAITNFMGSYTKGVITDGLMETVMLPYFGKFTPKINYLQRKMKNIRDARSGKLLIELAIRGRNINFRPEINPIHKEEPIPETTIIEEEDEDSDIDEDFGDGSGSLDD